MKRILCFLLLIGSFNFALSQDVIRFEQILITETDTMGNTVFQVASVTEFDNGRLDSLVSERVDSATFVEVKFNEAHNVKLPIKAAIQTLALRNNNQQVWSTNNDLLDQATGSTYFQLARGRGYTDSYAGFWRVIGTVDTTTVNAFFEVNTNGVGTEIDNLNQQNEVLNGLTLRFNPYDVSGEYARLVNLFPSGIEVAYLIDIVNDDDPNNPRSLRNLWSNEDRSVRLIYFPNVEDN